MAQTSAIPSYVELLWPTLQAIRELGGSGSITEIAEKVVALEQFTEEQQSVPHGGGPQTEIGYRLAWSRTYLKGMGLLDNSTRGVGALTNQGRDPDLNEDLVLRLHAEHTAWLRARRRAGSKAEPSSASTDLAEADQASARDWKEQLLDEILTMTPAGFERLA